MYCQWLLIRWLQIYLQHRGLKIYKLQFIFNFTLANKRTSNTKQKFIQVYHNDSDWPVNLLSLYALLSYIM